MYTLSISYSDIISALHANHKMVDKSSIWQAYLFANEKHKGQKRNTGEPYIMHSLRVANFLAQWGFDSDVIIAALLHNLAEEKKASLYEIKTNFGFDIAEMVDSFSKVNNALIGASGKSEREIEDMTIPWLNRRQNEKALLIKVADRLDNLYTINGIPEHEHLYKAQHTREVLIPLLKKEGAYELIDELEELCIRIEDPIGYQKIAEHYAALRAQNTFTTTRVLNQFKKVFKNRTYTPSDELIPYRDYIVDFIYNSRSTISIYRQLIRMTTNLDRELPMLMRKQHIELYDLTLIVRDNSGEAMAYLRPLDIFFIYFEKYFINQGISIKRYCKTTHGDSFYLILQDKVDNLYRLFIKSEKEYLHYKLGDVINDKNYFSSPDDADPRDSDSSKIKVFKKDGSVLYIDSGATVLDFAFAIHSEIGLHFDYALVNHSQTRLAPYTRLNEGEKITIVTKEYKTATISWFKYVRTSKAVDYLVRYFEGGK